MWRILLLVASLFWLEKQLNCSNCDQKSDQKVADVRYGNRIATSIIICPYCNLLKASYRVIDIYKKAFEYFTNVNAWHGLLMGWSITEKKGSGFLTPPAIYLEKFMYRFWGVNEYQAESCWFLIQIFVLINERTLIFFSKSFSGYCQPGNIQSKSNFSLSSESNWHKLSEIVNNISCFM